MISYGNIHKKNGYIMGIIFGILGGLICSIPWIFINQKFGIVSTSLAAIISYGIIKGYRFSQAKIDAKLRNIVIILDFICVSIVSLFIIPLLDVGNIEYLIDFYNISYINILKDYVFALVFSAIGMKYIFDRFYI